MSHFGRFWAAWAWAPKALLGTWPLFLHSGHLWALFGHTGHFRALWALLELLGTFET